MKLTTLSAMLPLLALTTLSHAVTIAPGQTLAPNLLPADPNEVLLFSNSVPLPTINGGYTYSSRINTVTNDLGFRFALGYGINLELQTITVEGYQGYTVDAGYLGGSIIPTSVARSADGDSITFTFNPAPASGSIDLMLRTDASDTVVGTAELQFVNTAPLGGVSTSFNMYQPAANAVAPVPEISTLSGLLLATASLAFRYRRRA
jgi:hypothetical protein